MTASATSPAAERPTYTADDLRWVPPYIAADARAYNRPHNSDEPCRQQRPWEFVS